MRLAAKIAVVLLGLAGPALSPHGSPPVLQAQANPFFGAPAAAPATPPAALRPAPGPSARLKWLVDAQRVVREVLADAVGRIAAGAAGALPLVGLSFAYGLLHALGPGHRKVALAAYFVARPARVIDGIVAGGAVAFLHAVSAVAVVYGLFFILQRSLSAAFASVSSALEQASYAAILILGFVLLALAVREWVRESRAALAPRGGSGDGRAGDPVPPAGSACCTSGGSGRRTLAAIILGSGVVPCPGAALVLIFCLAEGLPGVGALAALAMSSGMAVVTVGVSVAAIAGKRGLLAALPAGSRGGRLLHHGLELLGAGLVIGFGLLMLAPYLAGLVS